MRIVTVMLLLGMLGLASCATTPRAILDPARPHEVARDGELVVWVQLPDGSWQEQRALVRKGDVVYPPHLLQPKR